MEQHLRVLVLLRDRAHSLDQDENIYEEHWTKVLTGHIEVTKTTWTDILIYSNALLGDRDILRNTGQ